VSDELTIALQSLFKVVLVAALAPLVVGLMPIRVPQAVVVIIVGVIVGPQALDLAEPASIELLSNVGLGFLFLLAAMSWSSRSSGNGPACSREGPG